MRYLLLLILILSAASSAAAGDPGDPIPAKGDAHIQKVPGENPRSGGDTIASATVIQCVPYVDHGTTAEYTDDYDEVCPYTGSTSPDVVYSLSWPENITVAIDLCGSSYDTKLYVYDEGLNLIDCNDDYYTGPPCGDYVSYLESVELNAGVTYYIVVDGYGGDYGDYRIDITPDVPPVAQWTYLAFLCGDNNLELAEINNFLEMSTVGSNPSVKIVVQLDRSAIYTDIHDDWSDTRRGIVNIGDVPDTTWGASIGETNTGAAQTLTDFVVWGMQNFPAANYGLVVANHGNGWSKTLESPFRGIGDDDNPSDRLQMAEFRAALAAAEEITGDQPDLISLDACLMGMVEVAYELRNHCAAISFSEDSANLGGLPYNLVLGDLTVAPGMDAKTLGISSVTRYGQILDCTTWPLCGTMSAVCVAPDVVQPGITGLASAIDAFALALMANWNTNRPACVAAAYDVKLALDATRLSSTACSRCPGAYGLAIYFPETAVSGNYNGTVTQFAGDTHWDEFLHAFYNNMAGSWIADVRDQTQEFYFTTHVDLYDFCQKLIWAGPMVNINPGEFFFAHWPPLPPWPITCDALQIINLNPIGPIEWFIRERWLDYPERAGEPAESVDTRPELPPGITKDDHDSRVGSLVTRGAGGPDEFGYTWRDSDEPGGPEFAWFDITEVGSVLDLGDDDAIGVAMPWWFPFYGAMHDSLWIGSNGYLTFGDGGGAWLNQPIPTDDVPNDFISPWWDDLNPDIGGVVQYYHDPETSRFIVQYTDVPHYQGLGTYTFQVVLRPNGSIVFQYLTMEGEDASATIGIENPEGNVGLEVVFNASYVHDGLAIHFEDAAPWLLTRPAHGVIPPGEIGECEVCVDPTGLAPGVYLGELVVACADIEEDLVVPVELIVHEIVGVEEDGAGVSISWGNMPNPFQNSTTIFYDLPLPDRTRVAIYDVSGRLVRQLVDGVVQDKGLQQIVWDGKNDVGETVSSGIYYFRLESGVTMKTGRLVLVR